MFLYTRPMPHAYWELFFHVTWHTKDNRPLITPTVEPLLHKYLIHRTLKETSGAVVHAVGGIADHVHMAVSLPPTVLLSKWIGDIKGASSHHINHGPCGLGSLEWQVGYGAVSFGKGDLPWVAEYIRNQREHHARGTMVERLERIARGEDGGVPEGGIRGKPAEAG
jgi:putative transposase